MRLKAACQLCAVFSTLAIAPSVYATCTYTQYGASTASFCQITDNDSTVGGGGLYVGSRSTNVAALMGYNASSSGSAVAIHGETTNGTGVWGKSTGTGDGGYFNSTNGQGLRAYGNGTSSNGVMGESGGTGASGVYGYNGSGSGYGVAGRTSSGGGTAVYGDNPSTSGWAGYFTGRLYVAGTPYSAANSTFTIYSDVRLKKNIKPLEGALERLLQLRGVSFEWKQPEEHSNSRGAQKGFIAQDVEKVLPEWVGEDEKGVKTLNTQGIDAMFVESLRTLKAENDLLRKQGKALEERMKALESQRGVSRAGMADGLWGGAILALAACWVFQSRRSSRQNRLKPEQGA